MLRKQDSIAVSDILIPERKNQIIDKAQAEVDYPRQVKRYILTDGERYNKVIDIGQVTTT